MTDHDRSANDDHDGRDPGPTAGSDDDVRDLLGAHALDALDSADAARVERLLSSDAGARLEADRLSGAADLLAELAASGPPAPAGLWDSIAAQLDDPAAGPSSSSTDRGDAPLDGLVAPVTPTAAPPTADAPVSLADRREQRAARRAPRGVWLLSAAAVVVLLIVGAVAINATRDATTVDTITALQDAADAAAGQPGSRTGELTSEDGTVTVNVVVDNTGHAFVMSQSLPALDAGLTYQLWGVDGGTPVSLGLLADPTLSVVGVDGDIQRMAITTEPAGGSADPTTTPLASGLLT